MNDIENKVDQYIKKHELLESGEFKPKISKVYVAVSGGADSVALLHYMLNKLQNTEIELEAVHVNHGIRGKSADADMEFVKQMCKDLSIPLKVFDASRDGTVIPENASEEWARNLRYNYFQTMYLQPAVIATAHTLSDQVETILFRMARGTGMNGLGGIRAKRDEFIRPFLCLTRNEVEDLIEYYNARYITDETNLGDDYARNKIRHNAIPVLKQINPSMEHSFEKIIERISETYNYVKEVANAHLSMAKKVENTVFRTRGFIGIPDVIVTEMVVSLLEAHNALSGKNVDSIKELLKQVEKKMGEKSEMVVYVTISNSKRVCIANDYIVVMGDKEEYKTEGLSKYDCMINNEYGFNIAMKKYDFKMLTVKKEELCNFAALSKLDLSKCIIRYKREGDVFKPACKKGGKVSKFTKSFPEALRDFIPVMEYEGRIIWVYGVGFTDGFTPDDKDNYCVKFICNNSYQRQK